MAVTCRDLRARTRSTVGSSVAFRSEEVARRTLELGDTNDAFLVVLAGLKEGEEVVLDPLASVEEAQNVVLRPQDEAERE